MDFTANIDENDFREIYSYRHCHVVKKIQIYFRFHIGFQFRARNYKNEF